MNAQELRRRNAPLFYVGLWHLVLAAVLAGLLLVDARQALGIPIWIKPLKFAVSIAIFAWTIAWFSEYLKPSKTAFRVSWIIATAMVVEIVCIGGQSVRGTTSHFNVANPFDGAVFMLMGIAIFTNTFVVGILFALFLRVKMLPKPYLLGIQLGILLFIVGSFEAFAMLANNAHTVGLPDGGPGLPLVNWSTRGGDLRISHFLGLHAIQAVPLFGWIVRDHKHGARFVVAFALVYLIGMGVLFAQAMAGRPLLAL